MQAQQADKPHAGRSARKQAAPLRVPLEHRPGKAAEAAPTGQQGAGQRGGASAPAWPGGPPSASAGLGLVPHRVSNSLPARIWGGKQLIR